METTLQRRKLFSRTRFDSGYTDGLLSKFLERECAEFNAWNPLSRSKKLLEIIESLKDDSDVFPIFSDIGISAMLRYQNVSPLTFFFYRNKIGVSRYVSNIANAYEKILNSNITHDNDKYPFIPLNGRWFSLILQCLKTGEFKNFADLGCGWGDKLFTTALSAEKLSLNVKSLFGIEIQPHYVKFANSFISSNYKLLCHTPAVDIDIQVGNLATIDFSGVLPQEKTFYYSYSPFVHPSKEYVTFMENFLDFFSLPEQQGSIYIETYPHLAPDRIKKPKNITGFYFGGQYVFCHRKGSKTIRSLMRKSEDNLCKARNTWW